MSPKLLLSSLLLLTLISASTQRTSHTAQISATSEIGRTPLWMYGQYVYKREGCADCHTQDIGDSSRKISLDGLSARNSNWRTYNFLIMPDRLSPGCNMPSFEFLSTREQDFRRLTDLYPDANYDQLRLLWQRLEVESYNYYDTLGLIDHTLMHNSEILPLMYYIRHIPKSPTMRTRDSLKAIALQQATKSLDSNLGNPDWEFYAMIDSAGPQMLNKGRKLFINHCSMCHSLDHAVLGPNLGDTVWACGNTNRAIARTIFLGKPGKGMIPFKDRLSLQDVASLMVYLRKRS